VHVHFFPAWAVFPLVISSSPHDQHDLPFAKRPEPFEHLGNEIYLTRGWPNTYSVRFNIRKKDIYGKKWKQKYESKSNKNSVKALHLDQAPPA